MQDAQEGRFDVVLVEALDRVSRDQADVVTLYKHIQFAGVRFVTLAEGGISELHVGLKGTDRMNAREHDGVHGWTWADDGFGFGVFGYAPGDYLHNATDMVRSQFQRT